jgi:hypothetical protein
MPQAESAATRRPPSAGHKRDSTHAARRRRANARGPCARGPRARALGRARRDGPPRAGGRHRPGGFRHRADRHRRRRGLLQHGDDRIPGDPDRSVLCRADRHLHLPAYRQCRHQRRGSGEPGGGPGLRRARHGHRLRGDEAVELALVVASRRLAQGPRHRGDHRCRHTGAHRPHSRPGHAQRRDRQRSGGPLRPRGPEGPRGGARPDGGARPRATGDEPGARPSGRSATATARGPRARV